MIKVVGLGVKDGDLSLKGAGVIESSEVVIVKTALTDTYKIFKEENIKNFTCDFLYEKAEDFDSLNTSIVDYVLTFKGKVCYCVNGNGVDDRTVQLLKKRTDVEIISGVSRESYCLNICPNTSYVALSAYDIADNPLFEYDSSYPLVIKDIDNSFVASAVKGCLSRIVGEEEKIYLIQNESISKIQIFELDRQEEYNFSSSVLVESLSLSEKSEYNFSDLLKIMKKLRNGCEWDKAQTHESIRINAIEEAYELVEAINNKDIENIIEESGDVILQGVFHGVIGDDEGEFELKEVISRLCKKLISRHTHIFGNVIANNKEEALKAWEEAKAKEKVHLDLSDKLNGIANALPSLLKTEKFLRIVEKSGLDELSENKIIEKIVSNLPKFNDEIAAGEILFDIVRLLAKKNIKAEVALNLYNVKYSNIIKEIVEKSKIMKLEISEISKDKINSLWKEAEDNANRKC